MPLLNELKLSKDLIRYKSITPADNGIMKYISKKLRSLGSKCKLLKFSEFFPFDLKEVFNNIDEISKFPKTQRSLNHFVCSPLSQKLKRRLDHIPSLHESFV